MFRVRAFRLLHDFRGFISLETGFVLAGLAKGFAGFFNEGISRAFTGSIGVYSVVR